MPAAPREEGKWCEKVVVPEYSGVWGGAVRKVELVALGATVVPGGAALRASACIQGSVLHVTLTPFRTSSFCGGARQTFERLQCRVPRHKS